jgi:hypothetical protein
MKWWIMTEKTSSFPDLKSLIVTATYKVRKTNLSQIKDKIKEVLEYPSWHDISSLDGMMEFRYYSLTPKEHAEFESLKPTDAEKAEKTREKIAELINKSLHRLRYGVPLYFCVSTEQRLPDGFVFKVECRPAIYYLFTMAASRMEFPKYAIQEAQIECARLIEKIMKMALGGQEMIAPMTTQSIKTMDEAFSSISILERICSRFHSVARQIRNRREDRPTLEISDEYDVQDLLHGLLKIHFDDIRPEEWTPSYAGGCSRMDFLLKNEKIVVEVKKTSDRIGPKEIGLQIIEDKAKYKTHPDCKTLFCFVYDPSYKITNPKGLENDLNEEKEDFSCKVFIAPKET